MAGDTTTALAALPVGCYVVPMETSASPSHASADGVRWDLGELYASPTDPAIARDIALAREGAAAFAAAWRHRLATASPEDLLHALGEYERLQELGQRPGFYASLLAAADTQDAVALALEQQTAEAQTELRAQLVFFELELL